MTKITTIRIDDELKVEVDAVARADDVPASEVVRAALYRYIAERKSDPQFQARLRESPGEGPRSHRAAGRGVAA